MKTLWHLFKKDFTHLRLALVLWILLVGCELLFHWLLLTPASLDAEWFERIRLYAGLLSFITLAVAYLLIASLVLEDPLVGTQMFWATRPISGGRLLGAKLLGVVLLFGALPILVRLPWWLYCGYGWSELGRAIAANLALLSCLAIPAMVLAVFSGQSSRFLLFSLVLLVAIPIAIVLLFGRSSSFHFMELIERRLPLSILVFALGGIVAAVWQFTTRRLRQAVVILTAGAGLATACLLASPWRLDQLWPQDKTQLAGTEPISATILSARIFPTPKNISASEDIRVAITLGLKNVPDGEVLLTSFADAELRWPDGFVVRHQHCTMWSIPSIEPRALPRILKLPQVTPDPETARKQAELLEERRRSHPPGAPQNSTREPVPVADEVDLTFNLLVTPEVAARIKAEPPACVISARFVVGRAEVLFEMPMQAGAHFSGQGVRLQVLGLEPLHPKDGEVDPLLSKFTLTVASATALWITPSIYRVDRERGALERIISTTSSLSLHPAESEIARISYPLSIWRLWRTDQWVNDPGWLSRQTLAVVTYRKAGGFNRDLHLDRLPLKTGAAE